MTDLRRIAIVGAGLMGGGIAASFARVGHPVRVYDPSDAALAAAPQRIAEALAAMGLDDRDIAVAAANVEVARNLRDAVKDAGLVTEAAPERLALKQQIFADIEDNAPGDCIIASNTSVIPITDIVANLRQRTRALGTHWWNPPHMIPLVEVTRTEWTSEAVMAEVVDTLSRLGKAPVRVEKDIAGFIGNRLQHAMWREAISLVENGVCSAESVDTVVKSSFGRRLAVLGPLENADLVGTDLTLDIHNVILSELESSGTPSPYLRDLVATGRLGMKTGRGFRDWNSEQASATRNRVLTHLARLETILE